VESTLSFINLAVLVFDCFAGGFREVCKLKPDAYYCRGI